MINHTLTPLSYRVNPEPDGHISHWIDSPPDDGQPAGTRGGPVANIFDYGEKSAATAARMVNAYNSHDELVAALGNIIKRFETCARFAGNDAETVTGATEKARATLQHATEEPAIDSG